MGAAIGGAAVAVMTIVCLLDPPVYSTEIMGSGDVYFDSSYSAYLADEMYGTAEIRYIDSIDDYMLHVDLRHSGDTVLTIVSQSG